MGTVHTDSPLNDLLDLEIDDVEFHGFDDDEGDSNNDFYDALDTLDEEYPFQSLAPPPISRSYPTYQEAENGLQHVATAFESIAQIRLTNMRLLKNLDGVLSSVIEQMRVARKYIREGHIRKRRKRSRTCGCQMQMVIKRIPP